MFGFTQAPNAPTVVGDFLKYFPAAFWLTSKPPASIAQQIANREIDARGHSLDDWCPLSIPTQVKDTFRPDWPEHPTGYEALLLNNQACVYAERA